MDPFSADSAPGPRAARKAEFVRFHNDTYPGLVALLHALRGDRGHAHRAAQRAFADSWLRWERVRSLPDPAAWTRHRAMRTRPPRRRPPQRVTAAHESEWIAPPARPIFDALSELPSELRAVLALHHIGGLTHEQIADEEHLTRGEVSARLARAGQALAVRMGRVTAEEPAGRQPRALDPRVGRELADLAHALSYRTDRRAADQVFGQAVRYRVAVVAAAVALVAIAGVGGLFALRQYVPGTPEAAPGAASSPGAAGQPTAPESALPALPGIPPLSGTQPAPAVPAPPPGGLPLLGALPASGSPSTGPDDGDGDGDGEPDHEVDDASGGSGSSAHRYRAHGVHGDGVRPTATRPFPYHHRPPSGGGSPHPPTSRTNPTTPPPSTSPPTSTTSAPPPDDGSSDDGRPGSGVDGEGSQAGPDDQDGGRPRTHAGGGRSQSWPGDGEGQPRTRADGGGSQPGPGNGAQQRSRAGAGQQGTPGGGPRAQGGEGGYPQPGNGGGRGW
jgi:DNA-directed RNA polymerase specialized sigma24 family protein